jgi:D-alanyl-D-alanine carboxypeptidase
MGRMARSAGVFAMVGALLLFAPGGPGVASADGIDQGAVQDALDALTEHGVLGVQARITDGEDQFTARSGFAQWDQQQPVPFSGRFRIASITKPFVATVVLQLAAEGTVNLDVPVAQYVPGLLPDGGVITLRMLLQHTSGLFDYIDAFSLDPVDFEPIRYQHWDPEDLIAIATAEPLLFQPGTNWSYSNTNYLVVGLVIEAVTGAPYAQAVENRILQPLHLNATSLPGDSPSIPGPNAHGYYLVDNEVVDITEFNPSAAWASGEMISTTADLDEFIDRLLDGDLLPPAQQAELTNVLPFSQGFGLGLGSLTLPCGVTVWGFGGDIFGYSSIMLSTRDTARRLIVSISHAPDHTGADDDFGPLLVETFCS